MGRVGIERGMMKYNYFINSVHVHCYEYFT